MTASVRAVTPVLYVRRIHDSVAFYALLGFREVAHGADEEWSWAYLGCDGLGLLLASAAAGGRMAAAGDRGPVQVYCQADDVAQLRRQLEEGVAAVEHLGHPAHAPGGELRVVDPDGHVVMVAQTTGAPPAQDPRDEDRTSMLHRAAEAIRRGEDGIAEPCAVGGLGGEPCDRPAAVKLTDSWGDTAWSCLEHAEEALFAARGVYLASEDAEGLAAYLTRRRAAHA
jgi:catechol 2,3-dioxygenase-like lactoylglutathione lyase family enzyme